MHSCGVKVRSSSPMLATTASTVRGASLRKRCFSLAKTCSMGFRSGEYLGRKNNLAPADRIAQRMAFPLWLPRYHQEVASCKRGHQHVLDIDFEAFAVDWTVENPGSLDVIMPKGGHKGHGLPVAVRNFGYEPRPSRRPSPERLHVGFRPCLIDEDQALRRDPVLMLCPLGSPARNVGAIAFAGGFFEAQLLTVDEVPHQSIIDLDATPGEFSDEPA